MVTACRVVTHTSRLSRAVGRAAPSSHRRRLAAAPHVPWKAQAPGSAAARAATRCPEGRRPGARAPRLTLGYAFRSCMQPAAWPW